MQQAKVELTWDATNPNRTEAIRSALDGKIDDLDLKDYLASSSEGILLNNYMASSSEGLFNMICQIAYQTRW